MLIKEKLGNTNTSSISNYILDALVIEWYETKQAHSA